MNLQLRKVEELPDVTIYTDTREILRASRADAVRRGYGDWLIVDVDAHHVIGAAAERRSGRRNDDIDALARGLQRLS